MLQQKREQYHRQLQKASREQLFHLIRLELLSSSTTNRSMPSQDAQQEILESIGHFTTRRQPLDFEAINTYICDFPGPFRQDFAEQLLPLVARHFPKDPRALACAANLLSKCDHPQTLDSLDLASTLEALLQVEQEGEKGKGRPLVFLLYQLLRLAIDKTPFAVLPSHYPRLIALAGQFDVVTLLLLAEGSAVRALQPGQAVVESYLAQDIPYESVHVVGLQKLFEMIDNCLRFAQGSVLYQASSAWVERRLREKAFPQELKPGLIALMTMMANSVDSSSIEYFCKLLVFKEIMFLARFGSRQCKPPALEFLTAVVAKASPELLKHCAQEHHLLEVLIFAIELDLQDDLAFKVLTALAHILGASSYYMQRANHLGLPILLGKFEDCQKKKRVIEAALFLQEVLITESISYNGV